MDDCGAGRRDQARLADRRFGAGRGSQRRVGSCARCAQDLAERNSRGARAHLPGDDHAARRRAEPSPCSARPMRSPAAAASTSECRPSSAAIFPACANSSSRYPYTCLEQRVSIAVGLESRVLWDATMSNIDNLMDRDGLLKYWAFLRDGDDALTAYVLSIGDEAGWEIPGAGAIANRGGAGRFRRGSRRALLGTADRRPRHTQDDRAGGAVARQDRVQSQVARQHQRSSPTCGRPPRSSTGTSCSSASPSSRAATSACAKPSRSCAHG